MRSTRQLALIGRALLIVSMWNAPLPMVHAHSADIDDSADEMAFVEHLSEYHSDVVVNSHVDFGWHWHLVPPMEHRPGSDCPDGHHPCCPFDGRDTGLLTQPSVASSSMAVAASAISWLTSVVPVADIFVWRAPEAPTQFLETYLGSVPLGTLLRVARC